MTDTEPAIWTMFARIYERFNARDVDAVLASLTDDVEWPNGWEGGYVHGHDQVRDYWTRQWAQIDSRVRPIAVATQEDGRINVLVEQVVMDLHGQPIDERNVHHVYRLRDGRIAHMEIRERGETCR